MRWPRKKKEEEKEEPIVEIILTKLANQKLFYYIEECPVEISGFGKVKELPQEEDDSTKRFQIYDIEILPQEVSGADAEMSEEDLAKFLHAKMKAKKSVVDYKCWWHSHADFGAFFSSTDEGTIDGSTDFPYLISIVGNKAGDLIGRLDLYKPLRMTFEAVILTEQEENKSLRQKIRKEIEGKVAIKKFLTESKMGFTLEGDSEQESLLDRGTKVKRLSQRMTPTDRFLESRGYHVELEDEDDDRVHHKGRGFLP